MPDDPWSRGEHCIIPHHLSHALTPQISYTYFQVHTHLSVFTPQYSYLRLYTPVCISEYTPCSQHHLHFYQEGTTDTHWYSKLTWQCMWALNTNSWETLPAASQCWPPVFSLPLWPTQRWTCGSLVASVWAPGSYHSAPSAASAPQLPLRAASYLPEVLREEERKWYWAVMFIHTFWPFWFKLKPEKEYQRLKDGGEEYPGNSVVDRSYWPTGSCALQS